jgi:hypothetical protein
LAVSIPSAAAPPPCALPVHPTIVLKTACSNHQPRKTTRQRTAP